MLLLYRKEYFRYNIVNDITNFSRKVGDRMPNSAEIAKNAIDDFKKIQKYMVIAREENAQRTYAELKDEYLSLKAILNVLGVNLTDIDKIKE